MKRMNNKNHLSRIAFSCIMLLFVVCLPINAIFCSNYTLNQSLDETTKFETRTISENTVANEYEDVAIPTGFAQFLFLMFVFPLFFFALLILLPDEWTLINQKVRLDN